MGFEIHYNDCPIFLFSGENQLSQMSPHLLRYDVHFLLKWTIQNSPRETVKSTGKEDCFTIN